MRCAREAFVQVDRVVSESVSEIVSESACRATRPPPCQAGKSGVSAASITQRVEIGIIKVELS